MGAPQIPYKSDQGLADVGALQGETYRASGQDLRELGAFPFEVCLESCDL